MEMPDAEFLQLARAAAANAYVPYIDFPVGAAVETADGKIFQGCNIANACLPLGLCAERVAIHAAVANGQRSFRRIAVSCLKGDAKLPSSLMPCGACLQVIAEFFVPGAVVLVDGVGSFHLKDLLPKPFTLKRA
jgi:cytidine deaminase